MNYEFHVGDYVETVDEWVGYIESIHNLLHGVTGLYVRFVDGDCHCFEVTNETISNNFLRIGAYDFTKKEKKIKNLPCVTSTIDYGSNSWLIDKLVEARSKINELVDAVNKLMDDYDEHIETHRQADR